MLNTENITDANNNEDNISEINNWDDLDIDLNILRGIYAYGFEKPSPIQRKAIMPLIQKMDVIAQAQSGTGKTATFTIGALSRINISDKTTQVLCLSPTRELSIQTANVIKSIGSMLEGLIVQTLVGGDSITNSTELLIKKPPHIVTGCPGRINDMIQRHLLKTNDIKLIVLDEADELLSTGFKEQVHEIFKYLPQQTQVAVFSATMPAHIHSITTKFMNNPIHISVKTEQLTLEGISQFYIAVEDDQQKYLTLKDLYTTMSMSQCIIYANSVKRVAELYDAMINDGFPVCCIHSNMNKEDRDVAFTEFKTGKFRVLISSNVTARGIDIQQISMVINFDIPKCVHTYLHRIGRSGRWGRKGIGINLITRRDCIKMKEIEQHYSTQITELPANYEDLINR
jgi:translation initiation factor 4A